jgi:excisionase family DNA binding protein
VVDYYTMRYDRDAERLMTVREVARECKRTEETVRRWIWSGKLPATKLGNQLFVRREDLEALTAPRAGEAVVAYEASPRRSDMFDEYGYSPVLEALREDRGQILPSAEEEAANIADDEAFQDEVLARFERVDLVALLAEARNS